MKIVVDEVKLARNAKVARALVLGVVVVAVGMMIAVLLASMAPNSALFGQLNPATLLLVEIAVIILLFVVSRAADGVNGFRFDANNWFADRDPKTLTRPAGFVLHPEGGWN